MAFCCGYSIVETSGINGDAFYVSPDNTTIMLSDGATGAGQEGKVLMSKYCAKIIEENPFIESCLPPKDYIDRIIWKINNDLIDISQKNRRYIFGTFIICIVQNDIATIASVGDSPAYLITKTSVSRVAKARKVYQNLIEMGVVTEEEALEHVHNLPEYMWSLFDKFLPMIVPVYSMEEVGISDGNIVVLCCDGISDYINPDEIKEMINADSLSNSILEVINTAKERSIKEKERDHYDDLTMVIYYHK
jgi:protein phosphatase